MTESIRAYTNKRKTQCVIQTDTSDSKEYHQTIMPVR